jgi:hypothetical protein
MARKTPIEVALNKILIKYTCAGKEVKAEIESHNISSSESDCELCGSHGSLSIDIPTSLAAEHIILLL